MYSPNKKQKLLGYLIKAENKDIVMYIGRRSIRFIQPNNNQKYLFTNIKQVKQHIQRTLSFSDSQTYYFSPYPIYGQYKLRDYLV